MACRINFRATSDASAKLFQSCQNMSEIKFDEIVQNFLSPQNWYRTRVMKYRPIFVRLQTAVNYILAVRVDIKPIRLNAYGAVKKTFERRVSSWSTGKETRLIRSL